MVENSMPAARVANYLIVLNLLVIVVLVDQVLQLSFQVLLVCAENIKQVTVKAATKLIMNVRFNFLVEY